jgi:hypothetical protein
VAAEVVNPAAPSDDALMHESDLGEPPAAVLIPASPWVGPLPEVVPPIRRWPPPALAVRAFRWYWIAQWPTLLGTWMQVVALGYLVFDRTHSSTAVAAVAAADGLPAVVLSLALGWAAAAAFRRRF